MEQSPFYDLAPDFSQALQLPARPPVLPVEAMPGAFGMPMMPPAVMPPLMPPAVLPPPEATPYKPTVWDQLSSSPAAQMALLTFGLNALQPVKPGQTQLGHLAQSAGAGVGAFGQQKAIERKKEVEDKTLAQTDRRIDLDEQRVGLEGRRVSETEKSGEVQRRELEQKIGHNEKLYPKTIEKIDAEISRMIADGKLTAAQEGFWRERARLYPAEVSADLKKANAAMISATKPSGTEAIFESTAQAMFKSGEAKSVDDARAQLGGQFFSKSKGGGTAEATRINEFIESWKAANPKGEAESDQDYEKRLGSARQEFLRTSKSKDYATEKMKFLATSIDKERDADTFDKLWVEMGKELPEGHGKKKPDFKASDKIDAKKLTKGKTYNIELPDGSVKPLMWNGTKFEAPKR